MPAAPLGLSKDEKRDRYDTSKRGCQYGSREGDVIVLVRSPTATTGRAAHGRRTSSFATRLVAHSPANSSDPETASAFSLVPAVKAHLKNATIEALLDDQEVELVEAE